MSVDHESLKRVLMSIKGAARGFKKGNLQDRLKPKPPMDEVANPLDAKPNDAMASGLGLPEGSPMEEAGESPMEEGAEMSQGDQLSPEELEKIRKLIGSV